MKLSVLLGVVLLLSGCGASNHSTQVVLPNGVQCNSSESGSFWSRSTELSCTDASGKVIGSYTSS